MKKFDVILILLVLIVGGAFLFFGRLDDQSYDQKTVKIYVQNELYEEFELTDETRRDIEIDTPLGYNRIIVENGVATVIEADCKDQICVDTRSIENPGETIVCLPNKVVVEIAGVKNEDSIDIIVE